MAIPAPQQPIPHPEAPPPSRPEARAAQPQVRPPDLVEVIRLQADFITAQTDLDKARATLKTAQAVKAGHAIKLNSPEYQYIAKRQQAGESIDDIIGKSAANVRGLHKATLGGELPYREAEASLLRSEVGSPATEQDILRIVNGLEQHHALKLNDPALAEVNRRKQAGETLAEIKAKAQQVIDRRKRTSKTLRIAEAMKHPQNARPLDLDIEATIKNRLQAGETLDDIINKTRANLDGYAEIDRKKGQLAQTERRIEEIKSEKEILAGTKQREQELAAQRQLQQVRQQLESMQGGGKAVGSEATSSKESTPKLSAEVTAEFKNYIYQGGLLIKQGKYAEAMEYFRNASELAKVGRRISPARNRIVNELPKPEEYGQLADSMAKNSWNKDGGSIELSNVDYFVTGPDGLPQKQPIPVGLQHEISLVYMEEWLHSLQDIQGRPLAGQPDHEVDVAAYMEKNGIPMTEAFLRRYGRGEALEKAKQAKS
jgi:hypothetical protein